MGFGIATQTGVSAAIQSIPSMMANKGLRNGYGATFEENFTDGTNVLDPRITFSRASNATVTGSNGLIQYAPHNLLTYSEQFDSSAWTKSVSTVSANATTAPNGTTTADKIVKNNGVSTASDLYRGSGTNVGNTYTFSVYLKAGGFDYVRILGGSSFSPNGNTRFNISSGVVVAGNGTITSVGNGWYRCVITITQTSTTDSTIYLDCVNSDGTNTTGNGVSGYYVWGAQLEIGSTATTYNPTTVKNLLGYSEAFDNAAWTKSNSFIQTNLLLQSEAFDNAAWITAGTVNIAAVANQTTAPNGTNTADSLSDGIATGSRALVTSAAIVSGNAYTLSCYFKAGTATAVQIAGGSSAFGANIWASFNLETGVVGASGSSVTASSITAVGNGWYRCTVSGVATTSTSTNTFAVALVNSPTATRIPSYTSTTSTSVFLWGAQVVQGSVAGDYQQTTSAALPVQYQAPNGTMTADKLCSSTANSQHYFTAAFTSVAGTSYTFSMYGKAGESSYMQFLCGSTQTTPSSVYANFDLSLGVLGTNSGGSPTITSLGNGWYRCSFTFVAAASTSMSIYVEIGNSASMARDAAWAGDGTSGIYIWGAQLSDSASLDTYVNNPVAAPTAAAYYGARFDYDPVTLQPRGLLIEEQRTNLILRSEQFADAAWTLNAATITANTSVSPDGTTTADTLLASAGTGTIPRIGQISTATVASTVYTASIYAKAGTYSLVQIYLINQAADWANFVLTGAGTASANGSSTATITPVGNGWYRLTFTYTAGGVDRLPFFMLAASASATRAQAWNPAGTESAYIWGAQLEAGAFATSYIPTTSAQVTRSADVALIQGSNFNSWFNVNEGTIFTSIGTAVATDRRILTISDNTINNQIWQATSLGATPTFQVYTGGSFQAQLNVSTNSNGKTAGAYRVNDFAASVNGGTVATDTSGSLGSYIQMNLGTNYNSSTTAYLNGHIRQIAYYPRRLQNSELQAITS